MILSKGNIWSKWITNDKIGYDTHSVQQLGTALKEKSWLSSVTR
jgi:hypothetical protein